MPSLRRYWILAPLASLLSMPILLLAQSTPVQRLQEAFELEKAGHPQSAIATLQPLLDAHALGELGSGKAWNILALAYEDLSDFPHSQHAYEESIRIFERIPNDTRDYAMALNGLGRLYVDSNQFQMATSIRERALHLYESISDHAGVARVLSDQASAAFSQNQRRQGEKYLKQALKEVRLTKDFDDDDRAALASVQGWKAQFDDDPSKSILEYQLALSLWKKSHGEEHPFTGWGYMLLGKAEADAGKLAIALSDMHQGLSILGRTLSTNDPRYLTAELAYAQALDETGAHTEAAQMKSKAETLLDQFYSRQCAGCTVSAMAFH